MGSTCNRNKHHCNTYFIIVTSISISELNNVGCEDAIVLNASLNWESEEEEVTTMVDCFDIHILVMLMRECLPKAWRGRR